MQAYIGGQETDSDSIRETKNLNKNKNNQNKINLTKETSRHGLMGGRVQTGRQDSGCLMYKPTNPGPDWYDR